MLGSPSVKIHLLRGIAGIGLVAVVYRYWPVIGWWAIVPGAGALLCLGG